MPKSVPQFQSGSTIQCCHHCVPPKRHAACWGHCPEYLKERAEYEAMKAERTKKERLEQNLYAQRHASVKRAQKGGK